MNDETEKARRVFEALLNAKGIGVERDGHSYKSQNTQTKWRYFLLGWTLKNGSTTH